MQLIRAIYGTDIRQVLVTRSSFVGAFINPPLKAFVSLSVSDEIYGAIVVVVYRRGAGQAGFDGNRAKPWRMDRLLIVFDQAFGVVLVVVGTLTEAKRGGLHILETQTMPRPSPLYARKTQAHICPWPPISAWGDD